MTTSLNITQRHSPPDPSHFLEHYGLREHPFGVTPDPRFIFPSVQHRKLAQELTAGIKNGLGFAALIAGPGLGKTTILLSLLASLGASVRTALLFNTQCDSNQLLKYIAADLELPNVDQDIVAFHERLRDMLIEESHSGRSVLLVIDEAHNLDEQVLETVRLLSDFETPRSKLLHIILAGQEQLAAKLANPNLTQLAQRIVSFYPLQPLNPEEISLYVAHRLRVAGYEGRSLFSRAALAGVAEHSAGIPRQINRICFHALRLGAELQSDVIDDAIVQYVAGTLDLGEFVSHLELGRTNAFEVPTLSNFGRELVKWSADRGCGWSGTTVELLAELNRAVPTMTRCSADWPQDALAMAARLQRIEARRVLLDAGVHVSGDWVQGAPSFVRIEPVPTSDLPEFRP